MFLFNWSYTQTKIGEVELDRGCIEVNEYMKLQFQFYAPGDINGTKMLKCAAFTWVKFSTLKMYNEIMQLPNWTLQSTLLK